MRIDIERGFDNVTVTVYADLLVAMNVGEFMDQFKPILEETYNITLDLSRVEMIDSTGLGSIVSCLLKVKSRGGVMSLRGLSRSASSLCHLANTDQIMDVF